MNHRFACAVLVNVFALGLAGSLAAQVTSPEEHLGRPVGTDFELADWSQVSSYYAKLADESPCVRLETVGESTEGRDFLAAIISSEQNLDRLDEIKAHAATIADPRGKSPEEKDEALRHGKVIVFVTPTMHSNEVAATEMGMQFSWLLATSDDEPWRSARENAVVVITPSLNPDGVDHVVSWYREHVHTPYEGTSLTKLYQYYTGHDNNRDWFMLSQVETRILTRLIYQEWHPQFLWDVHQQGNSAERMFLPPYRDPLNPNLDPGIVAGINLIGTRAVMDMTREGYSGIATGVSYDNWWNGGNRSVPARHNIIGILTEGASVNIASPIFQERRDLKDPTGGPRYQPSNQFVNPWPGGWWRLSNIIDYELAFGRSFLSSINREPRYWLSNALEAAERSIAAGRDGGPRGWLIPPDNRDPAATRRLIDVLLASGVEVHVSTAAFEADGRPYPAGTIVIGRDQPYGRYVKDLFEIQEFPPGTQPYDVSGWTLPLLLGVRRVAVMRDFDVATDRIETAEEAIAAFEGDPRLAEAVEGTLSTRHSDSWPELVRRIAAGEAFRLVTAGEDSGLLVPVAKASEEPQKEELQKEQDQEAKNPAPGLLIEQLPRIGVYSPWSGSMDEGWLRWVLDEFEIPFITVRNETLRAGNLNDVIDVLILPDVSPRLLDDGRTPGSTPDIYAGGLDPEGATAVAAFVRDGGKLIAAGNASKWTIDLFQLPLIDVTRESDARGFSCPGSVLRGMIEKNPLTAGMPDETALFFSKSLAWRTMTDDEREEAGLGDHEPDTSTLLSYAPTRVLLSGFINKPEVIERRSAWVTTQHGEGRIHLFGFRPHYRAWSQAAFPLMFRAALFDVESLNQD